MKLRTASRMVDNPYYAPQHAEGATNPRQIRATINTRESAVETLFARSQLNRAQKAAADRFRAHWEACGGSGAGAIDYSRTHVDGGPSRDPISDRQIIAGQELRRCRELLGARGMALITSICGEGKALKEIGASDRDRKTSADMLRAHLDDLASMWGYAKARSPQYQG